MEDEKNEVHAANYVGVVKLAVFSRCLLFALFLIWRTLTRPYDTSAELTPPCLSATNDEQLAVKWKGLGAALEEVIVWDSVYYVRIAECGYEYEQTNAFFPVLPLLMWSLANTVLSRLVPLVGYRATLAISGYFISNLAFIYAALYLYKLTLYVVENEDQAWQATALFCFNPASVFYSSIYSESLFGFCSFAGLWHFVMGAKWQAVLLFGLSSGIRSNGLLHAGFFLFQAMHCLYKAAICQGRPLKALVAVLMAILQTVGVVAPFVAFQRYGYLQFCGTSVGGSGEAVRPWCNAKLPYLYGFVQSHYWNVGFLRYFEAKQILNFMLAFPTLFLSVCAIIAYGRRHPHLLFGLGFTAPPAQWWKLALLPPSQKYLGKRSPDPHEPAETDSQLGFSTLSPEAVSELRQRRSSKAEICTSEHHDTDSDCNLGGFFSPAAVCFLVQLAVMVTVATFVMHVQCSKGGLGLYVHSGLSAAIKLRSSYATFLVAGMRLWFHTMPAFHTLFLKACCLFPSHAVFFRPTQSQVATRFLSVSPPLYWYATQLMKTPTHGRQVGRIIWTVCFSFLGLGSLLFINFYPFT